MRQILFLFASLFLIHIAANSQRIYMSIDAAKQGKFKGEGRDPQKIAASGYSQEVNSPRDLATGQASGKRQYQPVYITKEAGASSPQFFQACISNEV